MHARSAQSVHRHRGNERGIDAARQAKNHAGKAVFINVIAQAQNAGGVISLVTFRHKRAGRGLANPVAVAALKNNGADAFRKRRQLAGERTIGVECEGAAVKHQLVLSADLIEIDQRQAAFDHARDRNRHPLVVLAAPIGRAVGRQQQLRARLDQRLDNVGAPDILADRQAKAHAAKRNRPWRRTGGEDPLFVKHAVIGQVDLEAHRVDAPAVEQRVGVVAEAVFDPRRAHQQRRAAVRRLARQLLQRGAASLLKGGLEHEVFGGIARQEQLGEHDKVSPLRARCLAGAANARRIAGDVADGAINLGESQREPAGGSLGQVHVSDLARRWPCGNGGDFWALIRPRPARKKRAGPRAVQMRSDREP